MNQMEKKNKNNQQKITVLQNNIQLDQSPLFFKAVSNVLMLLFDLMLTLMFILCMLTLFIGHLYIKEGIKFFNLIPLINLYDFVFIVAPLFVWRLHVRSEKVLKLFNQSKYYHKSMRVLKVITICIFIYLHLMLFKIGFRLYDDVIYMYTGYVESVAQYLHGLFRATNTKDISLEELKMLKEVYKTQRLILFISLKRFIFFFCVILWRISLLIRWVRYKIIYKAV
jgi:hypothetical protein